MATDTPRLREASATASCARATWRPPVFLVNSFCASTGKENLNGLDAACTRYPTGL
jgi:hypothetical protein